MINNLLNKFGVQLVRISKKTQGNSIKMDSPVLNSKPQFIDSDDYGDLYNCDYDMKLYLNPKSYVDSMILKNNVWEKESTDIIQKLVTEGNTVVDVGANFGYFSLMCAQLVGNNGQVFAFEPTNHFRDKFLKNLKENKFETINLLPFGCSDKDCELEIQIDASTASMHMPENDAYLKKETIKLTTLDQFVKARGFRRLDFIKADIDGHEPLFLKGAENTIKNFKPDMLIEINPLNYYLAGFTIWDFYDQIKSYGYRIYHEKNLEEITNKIDFLKRCGNFGWQGNWQAPFSLNVLLTHKSSEELSKIFS